MKAENAKINERLNEIREDKDITQNEVAEAIGTTKQQIYAYEKGINKMSVKQFMAHRRHDKPNLFAHFVRLEIRLIVPCAF